VKDALPYVARVDPRDGAVWIGTAAADALLRYAPGTGKFETFPLPTRGALVRHLAVDPERGAVWLAYGASPGIPARVARVVVKRGP
jgi:streptogramin lyase